MAHPKNQVTIICENCKITFSVKASMANAYRFCSMECRTEAKTKTIKCKNCGIEFTAYRKNATKYCSINCAMTARNLTEQNPSYHRDISGENNPMFGKGQYGEANGMFGRTRENNPAWKGGRKIRKDGYILVAAPENHPYAFDGLYILEHRLIMEKHIGRFLDPDEVVHHVDKNPQNNSIDNLILFNSQAEHIRAHSAG
jgi:hypothetical protein